MSTQKSKIIYTVDTTIPSGQAVYEIADPTTTQEESIALPKGVTHVYDANGVELTITERSK